MLLRVHRSQSRLQNTHLSTRFLIERDIDQRWSRMPRRISTSVAVGAIAALHLVRFWHKAEMSLAPIDVYFRGNSGHWGMSALPPKADIDPSVANVRFVPKADIRPTHYSITSSVQGDQ